MPLFIDNRHIAPAINLLDTIPLSGAASRARTRLMSALAPHMSALQETEYALVTEHAVLNPDGTPQVGVKTGRLPSRAGRKHRHSSVSMVCCLLSGRRLRKPTPGSSRPSPTRSLPALRSLRGLRLWCMTRCSPPSKTQDKHKLQARWVVRTMDRLIKPNKTNTRLPATPPAPIIEALELVLPEAASTMHGNDENEEVPAGV